MILKKPYAFLIRHFKKIHLILAITMAYMVYKTYTIYAFFRESAANNYYATLAYEERNLYVNALVLLLIIIIIGALLAIAYLLGHKNKPRKLYKYALIFYGLLFIYYVILNGVFKGLVESTLEMQQIRAYQDISVITLIPQAAAVIYCLLTTAGVTMKKFNFAADLKELEVNESDSEEVEVNINIEGYKTKRKVRRTIRELKYYASENRFVLTCIGVVFGTILGILIITAVVKKGGNLLTNMAAVNNKFTIRV